MDCRLRERACHILIVVSAKLSVAPHVTRDYKEQQYARIMSTRVLEHMTKLHRITPHIFSQHSRMELKRNNKKQM